MPKAASAEIGAIYSRWTVIGGTRGHPLCRCSCGTVRTVVGCDLRAGKSRSCGCLVSIAQRAAAEANRRHGLSDTPTHRSWVEMRRRCYAKHRKEYPNYGGRGITVCERWRDSFDNFLADMGKKPAGFTLDRIRNDRNYEPGNCRWLPRQIQELNKRNTVRHWIRGELITLPEAARKYGLNLNTLTNRVNTLGWAPDRAVAEPVRLRRSAS